MGNELILTRPGGMTDYAVLDKGWVVGKPNTYAWELNYQVLTKFPDKDFVLLKLNDSIFDAENHLLDGEWIATNVNPYITG